MIDCFRLNWAAVHEDVNISHMYNITALNTVWSPPGAIMNKVDSYFWYFVLYFVHSSSVLLHFVIELSMKNMSSSTTDCI